MLEPAEVADRIIKEFQLETVTAEGQECHPLVFCTGPVPAQQLDPFIPWYQAF